MIKKLISLICIYLSISVVILYADTYKQIHNSQTRLGDWVNTTISTATYSSDSGLLAGHTTTYWIAVTTALVPAPDLTGYVKNTDTTTWTGGNYWANYSTMSGLAVDKTGTADGTTLLKNSNDFKIIGSITGSVSEDITPIMTAATTPIPYRITQSSFYDVNTKAWTVFKAAAGQWWMIGTTGWCKVDYGDTIVAVSSYTITTGSAARSPKDWTIEGSNNDVDYTVLDTQTNITGWGASARSFSFVNTTRYRYIKMVITANNGDASYTGITLIRFYGIPANIIQDKTWTFRTVSSSGGIMNPTYKLSVINNGGEEQIGLDGTTGAMSVPGGFGDGANFVGTVNIGMALSGKYLSLQGSGATGSTLTFYPGNCSGLGFNAQIGRIQSHSNYGDGINLSYSAAEIKFLTASDRWYGGQIAFYTNANDSTNGIATEKMRLKQNGYLGVNATNPSTMLEVANGSITISGTNANLIVGGSIQVANTSSIILSSTSYGIQVSTNLDVVGLLNAQLPYLCMSSTLTFATGGTTSSNTFTYQFNEYISNITHSTSTNTSKVYIDVPGLYKVLFTACVEASAPNKHFAIWLSVNGVNVARSNTQIETPISGETEIAAELMYCFKKNDYFELHWWSDDAAGTMKTVPEGTSPARPISPSIIVTVNTISACPR